MTRRLLLAAFALLMTVGSPVVGTSDTPEAEDAVPRSVCTEPRPQMCTREYRPVCGERKGMDGRTYGNGCTACADPEVIAYRPGACG